MNDETKVTHFGYQQVPWQEKQQKVAGVFRSVAGKYDVMNDLISMGSHRLLKRMTIELAGVRPGHKVLDLAGGTGDLAIKFSRLVGETGQVVLADIPGKRRMSAFRRQQLPLHHHCLWPAQYHRQGCRPALHAAGIETRRPAAGAGVFHPGAQAPGQGL